MCESMRWGHQSTRSGSAAFALPVPSVRESTAAMVDWARRSTAAVGAVLVEGGRALVRLGHLAVDHASRILNLAQGDQWDLGVGVQCSS
ncbi:hypothetical protein WP39_28530 [Streptomyces sp. 604F]|nr:hypothetical protein [Streptomyces sp. 604F]